MTVETKERKAGQVEWLPEFTPASDIIRHTAEHRALAQDASAAESYYGVPMLKKPKWRWEIALYFFCEGISAGSFLLAALSELAGGRRHRQLARAGYYTAFVALLPCPPLLIADLGRPERFHHMLRVFKPTSPMNLGAWTLTFYSLPVSLLAARQLTGDHLLSVAPLQSASKLIPARLLGAAGMPLALTMISYPGVLLSTTSTPVWAKSRFLGALIACSSMSTAAAALSLALAASGSASDRALKRLEQIETVASFCEGAALAAYLRTSEDAARPLTAGRYSKHLWLGAVGAGLALPAVMRAAAPKRLRKKRAATILRSVLSLAGGLALKWAITHAGRDSAVDVAATRNATRPSEEAPGWNAGAFQQST